MKILVTGVNGQLGYDCMNELTARGIECVGADKEDFDITEEAETSEYIKSCHPDAVIHCAAYTAVDKAEDEKEICEKVNVTGARNVAKACEDIGAKMVYISTDYVFGDDGTQPIETDSPKNPRNVYGRTKLQGENEVLNCCTRSFIIRTSWVFGVNGSNFIKTICKLASERDSIKVVNDQIGSPTYTHDLAVLICDMVATDKFGIYHATNEGFCSWYDFACEIIRAGGYDDDTEIIPIPSSEYPAKAVRPLNSRLSKRSLDSAGFKHLPGWQDALARYIKELNSKIKQ